MARELENAEDAEDAEGDERSAEVLVVGDAEPDVVRQDGDDVDDAHHRADVLAAQRRGVQPQQVLAREQHDAGRVEAKELRLVTLAARQFALDLGLATARHRLGNVGEHGQRDEEAGDVVEDERRRTRLWVLERTPHLVARRRGYRLLHLFIKGVEFLHMFIYAVMYPQTGIKRRSKILELELLQEQSILTIKQ